MIRPIDIQILYPNTPEFSNRQQVENQRPNIQQEHFAGMMQKEQAKKRETVIHMEEGQKVRSATDQNEKKQQHKSKDKQKSKAKEKKKQYLQDGYSESQFDIRI